MEPTTTAVATWEGLRIRKLLDFFLLCNNTRIQTSLGPIGHFSMSRIFFFSSTVSEPLFKYNRDKNIHCHLLTNSRTWERWNRNLIRTWFTEYSSFYNTVSCRKWGLILCKNFSTYLSYWHFDPHLEHFKNYPYLFHVPVSNHHRHAFF